MYLTKQSYTIGGFLNLQCGINFFLKTKKS